uniref:CRAL-TRIO domain-containing protein n=1 Tax=Kalanchoe fedtschenkoi TaxID=63787 RepID=A0A7N0TPQ2_KALFE
MLHRITGSHNELQTADPAHSEMKVKELREALGPLTGRSLSYCTDACLRRYLEARNWNVGKAKKMLEESLEWRAAYRPEDLRWCDVSKEGETGMLFRANFRDRHGRTVLIMTPGKQNSTSIDDQMKLVVYTFENATFGLPEGLEHLVWLIDFTGWSLFNVPLKASRDFLSTMQNHFPERLAMCFLYDPPRIFHATFKIAKYFMDAKTFEKIKFVYPKDEESVEVMKTYFDAENLPAEFGGEATLRYDHEEYSRQMAEDDVKRAAYWALET